MSILDDLRSVFNPVRSYSSGSVINVQGDTALVSTIYGRVSCQIKIVSTLKEGDNVHIEDGNIVGKLRSEKVLNKYYV